MAGSSDNLPSSASDNVLFSFENAVAFVTLNRPRQRNAITPDMYESLTLFFRSCSKGSDVRAIVLAGAGGNFSSGSDMAETVAPLLKSGPANMAAFTRMTGELVKSMRACPQPIIAVVDGVCVGAGAALAMAADLRLAGDDARVAFLFNKVGLAGCDMGACAILPRLIGHARAALLLYTGRFMSADDGERWGFFSSVHPTAELFEKAHALARELSVGPPFATSMTKRMLAMEWAMSVDEAIEAESIAQALCMMTQDFARAFEAFASKTKPIFSGN